MKHKIITSIFEPNSFNRARSDSLASHNSAITSSSGYESLFTRSVSLESHPEEEEEEEERQQQPEERRASGMSIESNITSDHNQENELSPEKGESVIPNWTKRLSFSPETVFKNLSSSNIKRHNSQEQTEDNSEEAAQQLVESLTGRKVPPVFISLRD